MPTPASWDGGVQEARQGCNDAQPRDTARGTTPERLPLERSHTEAQALRAGTKNSSGASSRRNSCQLPPSLPSFLLEPSANNAAPKLKSSPRGTETRPEELQPKKAARSLDVLTDHSAVSPGPQQRPAGPQGVSPGAEVQASSPHWLCRFLG